MREVGGDAGLRVIAPDEPERLVPHFLASEETIRDVLVTGVTELHDDVVHGLGEARVANKGQRKACA